ncbi:MAG: hypothetical protein KF716_21490 [Anaerolineae bacterium]|nr:hypothetical protein [Anaerolineae bacterium]
MRRALLLMGIWAAFFGGALVAGLTMAYLSTWMLLLPMVILLAMALNKTPEQMLATEHAQPA